MNTISPSRVLILRGHSKSVKHISFHPNGSLVTTSSSDGSIYVFSITSEEASLVKKLEGVIPAIDIESEWSSKVVWHPDGTVFAAPTTSNGTPQFQFVLNKDVQLVSRDGWEQQTIFKSAHSGHITDLAWSPNGVYLATSGTDGKVHIWRTKDRTIVATYHPLTSTFFLTCKDTRYSTW